MRKIKNHDLGWNIGMKKTDSQCLAVENVQMSHSCFKAKKTGNEYLFQLDPLLNLLQSNLTHCNDERLFDEDFFG